MGITSAKQLTAALEKAKSVGLVEERFTIGDCEVVLRNLRPDEYESVVSETKDLEDLEYLNKWQEGHICRSIVEINGVDLRDTDFVEVEEADPKNKGTVRTIKRELHDWLRKDILSTWGREAIFTAYRKFSDVIFVAEGKAKEGVQFVVAEETAEEKFRRALGELKELEAEVPTALARSILEEYGYRAPQDAQALDNFDQTVKESGGEGNTPPAAPDEAPVAPPTPAVTPVAAAPVAAPNGGHQAAQIMRQRVPMNRQPVPDIAASIPPEVAAQAIITPPPAAPVATYNPPMGRTAAIAAAMSAEVGIDEAEIEQLRAAPPQAVLPPGMAPPPNAPPGLQAPVVGGPKAIIAKQGQQHTDPVALAAILNPKPAGVMNPKFNPRTK